MALSKRERIIAIVCLGTLALLVLDHYALRPLLDANERIKSELLAAKGKQEQNTTLLHRRDVMVHTWDEMVAGGLKSDPSQAAGEVLTALQAWADQVGLKPSSMTPDLSPKSGELREITVRVAGSGSMAAVSGFLWRLESSKLPLRIKDVLIGGREGTDELSLQVQVSTLDLASPAAKAPAAAKPTEEGL